MAVISASSSIPLVIEELDDIEVLDFHVHNKEIWLSKLAVAAGGKVAAIGLTAFQADSNNNAWSTAIKVIDVNDTPRFAGSILFDLHRLFVADVQRTSPYRIRILWGHTTASDAETAGDYSDLMFRANATNSDRTPMVIMTPRIPVGIMVWVKIWNSDSSGTLDFYIGLHEYAA